MSMKLLALIAVLAGLGALVCAGGPGTDAAEAGGRLEDDIDLPFVNDPEILGEWVSVDFVKEPALFGPGARRFDAPLYLKGLTFREKGRMTGHSSSWTKGAILDAADRTASGYTIKEIDGAKYLFLEWKSGDYTIRHRKPEYYVLKKN